MTDHPGKHEAIEPSITIPVTQRLYPWRAVARTVVATLVTAITVLNTVIPVILDYANKNLPARAFIWINTVAVAVAGVSGLITRIMAIPIVDEWLRSIKLSATK